MYGELMSRIGKIPVVIPKGVKIEQSGQTVKATGPLGSMQIDCHPLVKIKIDTVAGIMQLENDNPQDRRAKAMHGTMRALMVNMVKGVSEGFECKMEIYGSGYSAKEQGGKLVLTLGYCSPREIPIPKGLKIKIDVPATKGNDIPAKFTIFGIDKCLLGQFASSVRDSKPPEPYKGKGIRYSGEYIKKKAGKAFASGSAA